MRIAALLYALSWVAVRGMLVCGCPASKGGILRAISPAGRRFRASALVSGRKITMYIPYMCTFFLVFAFRDARFLSGLYGRFSYIVDKPWDCCAGSNGILLLGSARRAICCSARHTQSSVRSAATNARAYGANTNSVTVPHTHSTQPSVTWSDDGPWCPQRWRAL